MFKTVILAMPCLLLAMQSAAFASTVTSTLIDVGHTLEIADQGVKGFIEHIKGLQQSNRNEFDRAAAERIKVRLAPYLARQGDVPVKHELSERHPIDRFVRAPSLAHWTAAKREVQTLLMSVMHLLQDVKKTRPDFVADHVLADLSRFFGGDDSVESQLALMVTPSSQTEMRAAKAVRDKFWTLRRDLTKAQAVLADHVRHFSQTSAP
jgi:hypothetical protein